MQAYFSPQQTATTTRQGTPNYTLHNTAGGGRGGLENHQQNSTVELQLLPPLSCVGNKLQRTERSTNFKNGEKTKLSPETTSHAGTHTPHLLVSRVHASVIPFAENAHRAYARHAEWPRNLNAYTT